MKTDLAFLLAGIERVPLFRRQFQLESQEQVSLALLHVKSKFEVDSPPVEKWTKQFLPCDHKSQLVDCVVESGVLAVSPLKKLMTVLVNMHKGAKGIPLFLRTDVSLPVFNGTPGKASSFYLNKKS